MRGSVVIAGAVAQRPGYGGHTWVFLQYLLGFRRLGFDVFLVDRLTVDMCGRPPEQSAQVRYLADVLAHVGLDEDYAVLLDDGTSTVGRSRDEVERRLRDADALINVMGYLDDPALLELTSCRVYLDIDPGFGQMWQDLGLAEPFAGHDAFVTVGENIGDEDCAIPTCGLPWITTPQPVVLEQWPAGDGGRAFTSIGSWRGPYGPVAHEGHTYGLRVHEFRKFASLPRRARGPFEIALDIDAADGADVALLREQGWTLVDPAAAAGDPWRYGDYIRGAAGEICVAKNMYVDTNSGWFSDRSICFLASGRPVVAQDTGFTRHHPAGAGLLRFGTLEEAAAAVDEIRARPDHHARAARELADEHFDSDRVLMNLIERIT